MAVNLYDHANQLEQALQEINQIIVKPLDEIYAD